MWKDWAVRLWHLPSLAPSTQKEVEREPGPDAPRVPRSGRQIPRVLFTAPECRVVAIDLQVGEEMGEHTVRERAVVEVISGTVEVDVSGEVVECGAGTLLTFEPGERHAVRALDTARLLLVLTPWPAADHYTEGEVAHGDHLPANASVAPDQSVGAGPARQSS